MQAFNQCTGLVVPLDKSNVDTDAMIPKQFLKSIKRTGFGPNLFDEWRYLDHGEPGMDQRKRQPNPDFILNQARYSGATILLARDNFGCGSSREHAPWALQDYGFRAIIAPSFADIFYNNCFKNGILPIILSKSIVDQLFQETLATEGYQLVIDLPTQQITTPGQLTIEFELDAFRKECLIKGQDDIDLTLQHVDAIKQYELQRQKEAPWLFCERKAVVK